MAQPKKLEYTALFGLVSQVVFLLVALALAAKSGSRAVGAITWYVGAGILVWFLVLVHGRQRRLAREEREEMEQLRRTRLSEELFEETELDRMRASAGLVLFEKYLVPVFSVVLSAMLLYFAYRVGSGAWGAEAPEVLIQAPVAVGMIFMAFVGFLIGKYAAGLAQSADYRLLRAAGGYLLGNVIAEVMIGIAMGLYYFEVTWVEVAVTYIIPAIMMLVGLEVLLNLLLDIYRPRVPGQERRPPYDSRLLGLFAEPGGVLRTVAATLDYQFGFKVSETWFYRFMGRAIIPLVSVQVATLWLLSCLVVVDQDEIVFIENFARPYLSAEDAAKGLSATVFEPGFYLKMPWPFGVARHVPAYEVQSVELGRIHEPIPGAKPSKIAQDDIILWTERHINPTEGREANFLVPSTAAVAVPSASGEQVEAEGKVPQVNIARLQAYVDYRVRKKRDGSIDEDAAFTFLYRQTDIREHVERLAYRALARIAANQDFIKWISVDRGRTVLQLKQMVTDAIEREGMDLEVVFAGIPVVHPPAATAVSFEGVVTSLEQREATKYAGEQEASRIVAGARAEAAERKYFAEGYAARLRANAVADRDQFLAQLAAYRKAKWVYKIRTYLDAVEQALSGQRLIIVPLTPTDTQVIDLKEKLRPTLIDLDSEE